MDRAFFLSLFHLLSSWIFVGFSLDVGGLGGYLGQAVADQSSMASMPCVQKLLPCQPYLASPSSQVTACCDPLKEILAGEIKCLCDVFHSPDIMKTLNVTMDQLLNLPKACGADADISVCKTAGTPTDLQPSATANSSNATKTTGSPASSSTPETSSNGTTTKNAGNGISHFGGSSIVGVCLATFISAL